MTILEDESTKKHWKKLNTGRIIHTGSYVSDAEFGLNNKKRLRLRNTTCTVIGNCGGEYSRVKTVIVLVIEIGVGCTKIDG